jgi:hypothetical protein
MANDADMGERGVASKLREFAGTAKDVGHAALRETLTWSTYQWTVLALLTAIFLLVALSYGGIRAELSTLKQNAGSSTGDRTAIQSELGKQMADLKASLSQALADTKSALEADIAKMGTKLETRKEPSQPVAPAASPKPPAKPKPPQ